VLIIGTPDHPDCTFFSAKEGFPLCPGSVYDRYYCSNVHYFPSMIKVKNSYAVVNFCIVSCCMSCSVFKSANSVYLLRTAILYPYLTSTLHILTSLLRHQVGFLNSLLYCSTLSISNRITCKSNIT